ncbi:MAG TPA: tetratricopeptide repeat protein [Candidatus Dormibacteraeota bacterium]|nr:tetratricopeptide repeat protein [Candidatus Dormibacteraeota bacterium]
MAYNKSKFVEAAQKLLNQGKVSQAIAEYQHILKYEPRDQVTLMTVGELYIRQGETFQAIDYFERLAQIFVGDGFITKAIAVYKRIAKLAPEEIRPLEKLADLYVQQGVMSEARPLFLQLAEIHLKQNRQPEAVALLKKLLLAEPDNLRIQIRLADLYQAMGQTKEAVDSYVSASQRALARGDHAECEKLADKALKLDAKNWAAAIVKARSYSAQGDLPRAAALLEQVPDLEKGGEQAELLLDIYLKNTKWEPATALALRIFEADEKNFGPVQKIAETLIQSGQGEKAMVILARTHIPMVDAGEDEAVGRLLNELAKSLPGRLEPLEWLVEIYGRTSDSFRLPDALTQLGDALVAGNQLQRAKEIFERLVERERDSDAAKRKLHDVHVKMGLAVPDEASPVAQEDLRANIPQPPAPKLYPQEESPVSVVPPKGEPAHIEAALDDDTQKFIAQSLTDVDLFASYGLTQKAIGLLEAILRRAPRHTVTLEKLLDFVLGAGDDRRTAEIAAQLEKISNQRADKRAAERFGELRRRFQRAAGLSDEELAAAPVSPRVEGAIPEIEVTPFAPSPESFEVSAAPPAKQEIHEVDLSEEWASELAKAPLESAAPRTPAAQDAEPATLSEVHAAPHPPLETPAYAEFDVQPAPPPADEDTFGEHPRNIPAPELPSHVVPVAPVSNVAPDHAAPPREEPAFKVTEPEFEIDQEYELVIAPEPLVPAYDQKPPDQPLAVHETQPESVAQNVAPAGSGMASDQFLADLANEMGLDELTPSYSNAAAHIDTHAPANAANKSANSIDSGPLKEVFDDFRAELGEMGAEDEDLETHYNLGTAFREMGLLEEAISEFQKVAKANERGRPFRYAMQCCTLLGLAFMEKGQPGIAAIWYERALKTPGVEPESILALRYDLGVAQESAGEPQAALKSFSQVYAMNIDYRDVAERIASLQKPAR